MDKDYLIEKIKLTALIFATIAFLMGWFVVMIWVISGVIANSVSILSVVLFFVMSFILIVVLIYFGIVE